VKCPPPHVAASWSLLRRYAALLWGTFGTNSFSVDEGAPLLFTDPPPEFLDFRMVHITSLSISYHPFKTINALTVLSNLTALAVAETVLEPPPPFVFAALPSLTALTLSYCRLNTLPLSLGVLEDLRTLILTDNAFAEIPWGAYKLSSLETLSVSKNRITYIPPQISSLASLRLLAVDHNLISTLPPEMALLSSLQEIALSANEIKIIPPPLGAITALTSLDFDDNPLTFPPAQFRAPPPNADCIRLLKALWAGHSNGLVDLRGLGIVPASVASLRAPLAMLGGGAQVVSLAQNKLNRLPFELFFLSAVTDLDLSDNQLNNLAFNAGADVERRDGESDAALAARKLAVEAAGRAALVRKKAGKFVDVIRMVISRQRGEGVLPSVAAKSKNNETTKEGDGGADGAAQAGGDGSAEGGGGGFVDITMASFPYLVCLNISRNALRELPVELGALINLTTLVASFNELGSTPGFLFVMPALETLDLSHNDLSALDYRRKKGTEATAPIVLLNLSFNRIDKVNARILCELGGTLQRLLLAHNSLPSLSPRFGKVPPPPTLPHPPPPDPLPSLPRPQPQLPPHAVRRLGRPLPPRGARPQPQPPPRRRRQSPRRPPPPPHPPPQRQRPPHTPPLPRVPPSRSRCPPPAQPHRFRPHPRRHALRADGAAFGG
jgi:Leucine-rich repeat (LRR) protein